MAQSLENKYNAGGSRLGYPNNPSQKVATGVGPTPQAVGSTIHNQYSYDGNPIAADAAPRFENAGPMRPLPEPTQLQAFTGPQNTRSAAAGAKNYNNQSTYDDFILAQGGKDGAVAAARFQGEGSTFL